MAVLCHDNCKCRNCPGLRLWAVPSASPSENVSHSTRRRTSYGALNKGRIHSPNMGATGCCDFWQKERYFSLHFSMCTFKAGIGLCFIGKKFQRRHLDQLSLIPVLAPKWK